MSLASRMSALLVLRFIKVMQMIFHVIHAHDIQIHIFQAVIEVLLLAC